MSCETLKQLATDSNKHRAKKDRRQQRSSFRDILRALEEGGAPRMRVKFGTEAVSIHSWSRKRQYDALCQVLGSGMPVHLQVHALHYITLHYITLHLDTPWWFWNVSGAIILHLASTVFNQTDGW